MQREMRQIGAVAAATLLSRLLGLLRDVLQFALLGASVWQGAFIFGFTLPNLFRRLLGEGALTSAVVPALAQARARGASEGFYALLNPLVARLAAALGLLVCGGSGLLLALDTVGEWPRRWELGLQVGAVLMPYLALVCLAAILGAALNVLGRFTLSALSQVWLNLALITVLAAGLCLEVSLRTAVVLLCGAVLLGGILQLSAVVWGLWRQGWRPRTDPGTPPELAQVRQRFLPAVGGAAIFQINSLVARVLAFALSAEAVSAYYLANRLIELPLGVFALAVTTVHFPAFAEAAARADAATMREAFRRGWRVILAITMPAAGGLIALGEPILRALFAWGRFGADEAALAHGPLVVFACALPCYAMAAYQTRALHALGEMTVVLRWAGVNLLLCAGGSLALMDSLGVTGLALANAAAMLVHVLALGRELRRRTGALVGRTEWLGALRVLLAAGLMVGFCFAGRGALGMIETAAKLSDWLTVGLLVPGGMAAYGACLMVIDRPAYRSLRAVVQRKEATGP